MITLTRERHLGRLLRDLRRDAGLTLRQLGAQAHVSKSAVSKREVNRSVTTAALIDHAHVLGFDLALIPKRQRGSRPTGTGWPT
jgi:transcriptional regulator with XRE-family HTH domain